jgi:hypothetical protein
MEMSEGPHRASTHKTGPSIDATFRAKMAGKPRQSWGIELQTFQH